MKWINHQMIGFGAGYFLTGELSAAVVASVAAVLPDAIEKMGGLNGPAKHHGRSHNPLYWAVFLPIGMVIIYFAGGVELFDYTIVFFLGLMTHLVCDALTVTGIPISWDGETRLALKLFPKGSILEYAIAIAFLVLSIRGYLVFFLGTGGRNLHHPIDLLNPLLYIQNGDYICAWNTLYELIFKGFMARFFAAAFLLGALWFGFYRQNFLVAGLLFFLTVVISYLGSVVDRAFWYLK